MAPLHAPTGYADDGARWMSASAVSPRPFRAPRDDSRSFREQIRPEPFATAGTLSAERPFLQFPPTRYTRRRTRKTGPILATASVVGGVRASTHDT